MTEKNCLKKDVFTIIHFTLGPVEMYPRTKAAGSLQNPYFRTSEFSSFMKETEGMLKQFLNVPPAYHTMFLASSGTGAMEATLLNCLTPGDKALIINGGTFSAYFMDLCRYQGIPFDTVDVPFGKELTPNLLLPYEGKEYAALLVNIHETSTGQLYGREMLRDFCKRNEMYYFADAISSVCADELDVERYGMDSVMLSSQKGFALPPGLGIVIISDGLYDKRVANNKVASMYFDFKEYVKNMTRYNVAIDGDLVVVMSKNLEKYYGEYVGVVILDKKTAEELTAVLDEMIREEQYNEWHEDVIARMIFRKNKNFFYYDMRDYEWTEIDNVDDLIKAKKILHGEAGENTAL